MTGFLIPIRAFSPSTLAVVRFATEFGKRSNAKLYFLFVQDPGANKPTAAAANPRTHEEGLIHQTIETLISCGRDNDGLLTEIHQRGGDYFQEVRQFVRDHQISEIIVSLPDEAEPSYAQSKRDIQLLLQMTHCRILTVKPKTEKV